jgi:RNA polymerase sigma-70 factor (ECF subfamily)
LRESGEKTSRAGHIPAVRSSLQRRIERDTSFERLYRTHRRDVYGAVLRDVRDPDEAEDVTQIAFLNAFRAMRKGEEPDKPRAWLVTIARNVIRRRYRELARRPQEVALDPEVAAAIMDVDGPTAGEIAAAVRRLPENQRTVILLREIQGRSYSEIADEMGLTLAAVETLIFRARGSLSEELERADRVPATRPKRARALGFLPLPGFGKLSFGISFGRLGIAALLGGAMVAIPVMDSGADPPAPSVERAPSAATASGAAFVPPTALGPVVKEGDRTTERSDRGRHPAKKADSQTTDSSAESGSAVTDALAPLPPSPIALPSVDSVPSTDGLPTTDELPLPPLPPLPTDDVELPPPPDLSGVTTLPEP